MHLRRDILLGVAAVSRRRRMTFRNLVERFVPADPSPQALKQLPRDSNDLINADSRNEDVYAGVRAIAVLHMKEFRTVGGSDEVVRTAHDKVLRACFPLLIALFVASSLRARTQVDVLNEFDA